MYCGKYAFACIYIPEWWYNNFFLSKACGVLHMLISCYCCELHMYLCEKSSDLERHIWTMYCIPLKWIATDDVYIVLISGTSDPYVKFKSDGKQIYKSKTVQKNLNPQWNEKFCVPIEDVTVPLILKVLDFDRVGNDDPMGRAVVDLAAIEIDK